jgi:subtilisin family serine protease
MKRILLLINLVVFTANLQAQEKLNYQLNKKNIEFTISQNEVYVEFTSEQKVGIQKLLKNELEELTLNSAILKTTNSKGTYQRRKEDLKNNKTIRFQKIEPILIYSDGTRQIAKGELNIKINSKTSLNKIFKGIDFTYERNEFDKNIFLVKTDIETFELIKLINLLQKDKNIEFVEPNFSRLLKPSTDDQFFTSQWSINNQGYLGGTNDADMDVDEAWAYSTGSGIKIAVIDEGVDLTHPDLTPNLLTGFDATGNNSNGAPNEVNKDAHGTACAGIIAGVANNTEGVAGIAYNAKIIPVRIAYSSSPTSTSWITNDTWIANGINWAWQNGADVLSNSYGGGSYSNTIEAAINNAVNNGRNGKGSVVVFASGNNNGNVSFPATVANAIAVGASSMCDERKSPTSCDGETWWGSNFGTQLDVVAPGVKIYTTDISGSAGYELGDYKANFNGTSSACPNTAGVVALILSANPNLTQTQAREILERNVDKVNSYSYANISGQPNGTWNTQVGYGRINAKKALEEVIYGSMEIVGGNSICSPNILTYTIQVPSNITVNWAVSSNLQIIPTPTNTNISVKPISSSSSGQGWIDAILPNQTVRKYIWVGKPALTSARLTNGDYIAHTGSNTVCKSAQITTNMSFSNYDTITWSLLNSSHTTTWGQQGINLTFYLWANNHTANFKVTMTNACGSTTKYFSFDAENCSGGGDDPCALSYSVYPNPASSQFQITPNIPAPCGPILANSEQTSTANLYDLQGNLWITQTPASGIMNVESLAPGIYVLVITTDEESTTQQIVIN